MSCFVCTFAETKKSAALLSRVLSGAARTQPLSYLSITGSRTTAVPNYLRGMKDVGPCLAHRRQLSSIRFRYSTDELSLNANTRMAIGAGGRSMNSFVYPFCGYARPVQALTDCWITARSASFLRDAAGHCGTQKGRLGDGTLSKAGSKTRWKIASWFDSGKTTRFSRQCEYGNLWVPGGPRARRVLQAQAARQPALNGAFG